MKLISMTDFDNTENEALNKTKLQAMFLAPYLPYGLKVKIDNDSDVIFTVSGIDCLLNSINYSRGMWYESASRIEHCKPILKPISDLEKDKNFTELYYISKSKLEGFMIKRINETYTRLNELDFLYRNHYDVFGLIEKGLAISIYDVE